MNKHCSGSNLKPFLTLLACTLLITAASTANAAAVSSTGSGDWETAGTWSPSVVPGVGDDVTISVGHTITINGLSVKQMDSLSVSGTLQHEQNSSSKAHMVDLDIANDLTVAAGGEIEVTGRGYSSGGPGVPSASYSGGSHGGRGGLNSGDVDDAGITYGSLTAPETMGSAASSDSADGGGVIKLTVGGTTTVDGTIEANGEAATYTGGAGGSVFITTANFGGSGSVTANGAQNGSVGGTHGAGGGGRVAIVLTSGNSFGSVTMTAERGCGTNNKGGQNGYSSAGTVYTKTASQTYGTVSIDNSGYGLYQGSNDLTPGTYIPSNQTWQVDRLELSGSGNLFVGPDATLNVASGDFSGSDTNGSLVLFGTAVLPASLTISNIMFMPHSGNTLSGLTDLTIASGVSLTHLDNSTTEQYKLEIDIPGDITLEAGASIDVTGLGYDRRNGPGAPTATGIYSGGGHGGSGGAGIGSASRYNTGGTYGSVSAPTNIGSGSSDDAGGTGGGAVRLSAGGTTTIDGDISANGGNGNSYDSGAGGSIFITTANFAGSGTISANGGLKSTSSHGAGGGGRVAVVLTSGATFGSVTITANRGAGSASTYGGDLGRDAAGTIFTKTPSQTYGRLKVDNQGIGLDNGDAEGRDLGRGTQIPAGHTWQLDELELVNQGAIFVASNSTLNLTGTDFSPSSTNGYIVLEAYGSLSGPPTTVISNITFLPLADSTLDSITNLTIDGSAIVTHPRNTTTENWKMELDIPGNLTVRSGAMIHADEKGYWRGNGPAGGGNYGMGGGYGGQGGHGRDGGQVPDPTYGSITAPTSLGSAGQRYNSSSGESDGGGAIKLTVGGTTSLDGTISAGGRNTTGWLGGGGAGGAVWISTSALSGSGTIRANGGTASNNQTAGGGGGRIAVYLTGSDSFGSVAMQAYGGDAQTAGGKHNGAAGTIYKQTQSQAAGRGELIADNGGTVTTMGERTQISSAVTGTEVGDVIIRNAAHFEVDANQSLTVYGGWSNGYAFAAGTDATVELAGTDTVNVYGDNTFDTLVVTGVTKQINFQAGATQDVDNVFTLEGPGAPTLLLRSASPGAQWFLNLDAGAVTSIDYVDVSDSNADHGTAAAAGNSVDSGNNDNWVFGSAGQTNIWVGPTSTDWGEVSNWTLGRAPIGDDAAVVISNGTFDPTMPSAQTFNNLEVQAGAVLSIATYGLTVNADTTVAGTIIATGSETIAVSNLTVSGALTLAGTETVLIAGNANFTGGTFTKASSHAILNGSIAQTLTSAGQSFNTLTVSNSSALVTFADAVQVTTYESRSADVTYGGNLTATSFYVYSASGVVTHTFNAGSTYTMGELWLYGSVGNVQNLVSSSSSAWNLNVSSVASVSYVDVEYSDASGGIEILAQNSTDSGNNVNWNFGPFSIWTGDSGTSFHTAASWSPSGVPDANTYIIVDDTTTLNIGSPATVRYAKIGGVNATLVEVDSDFTVVGNVDVILNGTIEINNDPGMTVGTNMSVASGGTLTHAANSTTEADRMVLTVGNNLTIDAGAAIDVTEMGYAYSQGPGEATISYSGGSHGGVGGLFSWSTTRDDAAPTYGSYSSPTNFGSGGESESGARGGGAVQITVGGTTTIDGTVEAEGSRIPSSSYGAGAGGSVYITTANLAGSGTISANGGWSGSTGAHGAGGGGRIAVVLTSGSTFGSVAMTAYAGGAGTGYHRGSKGMPSAGTIYTKTPGQTHGVLQVDAGGDERWVNGVLTLGTKIPDGQTWQVDRLDVVNGGTLFVETGETLNLASGDFSGSDTNGSVCVFGTMVLSADVTISNVTFMPHSGNTLSGLVNLTVASGGLVTHLKNNNDTETYKLEIDIPGNLTVDAGGKIDVTADGYAKLQGPGAPSYTYNGPAHGGGGGWFNGGTANDAQTYGSILAPTNAGSGPGSGGHAEADGGGVIRLAIGGATTVNGEVLADGGSPSGGYCGGAGGSIYLTSATLAGSGTIRAGGGEYSGGSHTGSGGGGRVAVVLTSGSSFGTVDISARGGTIGSSGASGPGTVYLESALAGSGAGRVVIDCKGEDNDRAATLPAQLDPNTNELASTVLVVTNTGTKLTLVSDVTLANVLLYAGVDVTLGSYTMYVYSVEHNLEDLSDFTIGVTNQVDDYSNIIWLGVDSYQGTVIKFL